MLPNERAFLEPLWLWGLLGLPLIALVLRSALKSRATRLEALGATPSAPYSMLIVPLCVIAALVLALARPSIGSEEITFPRSGRDLMLVVDVSLSMSARDVSPSRIDLAKRKIFDIIELISSRSPGDRLGIVLFAGESYLYCPLTADYAVVKTFANAIQPGLIASGGSAITQALVTAANSFASTKAQFPALLLISDGEDNELVVARSVDVLRGFNLKLWALGVGTPEGKPIEIQGRRLLKDSAGNIVVSKLEEAALRQLAERSGGMFVQAGVDDRDLETLFQDIHARLSEGERSSDETTVRVHREIGPYLLWAPLLLMTLLLYVGKRGVVFLLLVSLSLRVATAYAEPETSRTEVLSPYEAAQAYERGDFAAARDSFAHHLEQAPGDLRLLQSLASAEFRLGNFAEASKLFEELAAKAQTGRDKYRGFYDKGTSDLMDKRYDEAIESLEESLRVKPEDEAARHNLDIAKRLREEQKKQEPQQDQQQKQDSNEKDKEQQKEPEEKQQEEEQKRQQSSDQQQQEGSPEASQSSENEEQNQKKQQAQPTAAPEGTPKDQKPEGEDEEKPEDEGSDKESQEKKDEQQTQPQSKESQKPLPQHDPKALKEQEAQAWLESLDDSPVLLRRHVGNKRSSSQQSW